MARSARAAGDRCGVNALADLLARRISVEGPLSIAEYMAQALFHPEHGYYSTREPFGARGDFITAPEISQMFGELLGLWCIDCWQKMGSPRPVSLVELGPGRGTLMRDALRAARVMPAFLDAIQLRLVEASPKLRALQAAALAPFSPLWYSRIEELPEGPFLMLANEFLDALPTRQFVRETDGWHERVVELGEDGHLAFGVDPDRVKPAALPRAAEGAPPGSICETSPLSLSVAGKLGRRLKRTKGAALFIDYGYYPDACGDTLQSVRNHKRHEILVDPGEADITAHVDFASFAATAEAAGARSWGPVAQGSFLMALGIRERAVRLAASATQVQIAEIASASRRLVDGDAMGRLFKVLALTDPGLPCPSGFEGVRP